MLRGASFSLAGVAGLRAGALLFTTDRRVPRGDISRFKHVVAVFPHADDETVTCGGTLHRFAAWGALVTLVLLTGGERGITDVVHASFGDAELSHHVDELTAYLTAVIEHLRPDLLITYDLAGLD